MKRLTQWLLVLFAMVAFLVGPTAMAEPLSLIDDAHLLTHKEQDEVENALKAVEKKHHVRLAVVTIDSLDDVDAVNVKTPKEFTDWALDTEFHDGEKGNMVLTLIMDSRDWTISTDKQMRQKITDGAAIDHLSDAFLSDLKDGHYASAFKNYAGRADDMLTYYETEGEAYDPDDEFDYIYFGLAVLFALAGGFGLRQHLIAQMSNVRPALVADAYLDKDSFALTHESDTFLFMNVTRVKKEHHDRDNDNSSGGGSSHGGGGGKF